MNVAYDASICELGARPEMPDVTKPPNAHSGAAPCERASHGLERHDDAFHLSFASPDHLRHLCDDDAGILIHEIQNMAFLLDRLIVYTDIHTDFILSLQDIVEHGRDHGEHEFNEVRTVALRIRACLLYEHLFEKRLLQRRELVVLTLMSCRSALIALVWAPESTSSGRTEDYGLADVENRVETSDGDCFVSDFEDALAFWGVSYTREETLKPLVA